MHAAILNREGLERVGKLLADGTVKVPVQRTVGLDEVPEALGALNSGHTQGKIAVRVA
jgi:NADPH-dependent curcumin reductase CurA